MTSHDVDNYIQPIVEDRIFAIGGSIDADQNVSWMPLGLKGHMPVQAYLLRSETEALLVDTGLVVHQDQISAALERLVGDRKLEVSMTRREMDTIMNLPWIVKKFDVERIHFTGDISPLDFFQALEEAAAEAQTRTFADVDCNWLRPGTRIGYAGAVLEIVRPAVRVLATQWLFERNTNTLFSSDFLGFIPSTQDGPTVIRDEAKDIGVDQVIGHLERKFDWLRDINAMPILKEMRRIIRDHELDRLCPCYGAIVEGEENVTYLWDKAIEAIETLAVQPRVKEMAGFPGLAGGDLVV